MSVDPKDPPSTSTLDEFEDLIDSQVGGDTNDDNSNDPDDNNDNDEQEE